MTSLSLLTATTISSLVSVPESSLSMSSKQRRAAERNWPVNSAISFWARFASASRLAARCWSLFLSAISMHSSLRETSTGEPRRHRERAKF